MVDYLFATALNIAMGYGMIRFLAWVLDTAKVPEGKQHLYVFFFCGILTVPLYRIIHFLWLPRFMPSTGIDWIDWLFHQVFVTGLVEEGTKFAIFYLVSRVRRSIREPRDGLIQVACIAIMFAMTENFEYIDYYGPEVMDARLFSYIGHISFTATSGWAYARIKYRLREGEEGTALMYGIQFVAFGALLHGLSNFFLKLGKYHFTFSTLLFGTILTLYLLKEAEVSSPFRKFALSEWMEAAACLREATRRDPLDSKNRERLGFYLLYGGRFKESYNAFYGAALLEPKRMELRAYAAAARILGGDPGGVFPFKLALFEAGKRNQPFIKRLLRKVARDARRWPELKVIMAESLDPSLAAERIPAYGIFAAAEEQPPEIIEGAPRTEAVRD